jgi:hypothetical protein
VEPSRGAPERSGRWRRGLVALLAAAGVPAVALGAPPSCETPPGFEPSGRLASANVVVLYRTVPAPIAVDRPFAVEAVVCPAPVGPEGFAVDAYMPEHRHGMNYRPRVSRRADGVYLAEGLLFHMPGHWQLRFDVARDGRNERLSADVELD